MRYLAALRTNFVILTLGILGLVLVACGGGAPVPTAIPTVAPAPTAAQQFESEGHRLFVTKGCAACHGQNAEGSAVAPALAGHTERRVREQVRNPRFRMPAFSAAQVSKDDLDAIAKYISGLEDGEHVDVEPLDLEAALEMHHWMALESLRTDEPADAIHHVKHIIVFLEGDWRQPRMQAILESLQAGETHEPEHKIEEMVAGVMYPDMTMAQLHLRQAMASMTLGDAEDARHHMEHFTEVADPKDQEHAQEIMEMLERGDMHGAEHGIEALMGAGEHGH